ncbi:MAG: bifunctional riboflavin kinase/FAD synthetase [Actinomycetota bacterium]
MRWFQDLGSVPKDFGPSAVTIGKFDGVHLGHRRVIDTLKSAADQLGLASVVVTFDRHPLALLSPEKSPPSISSNEQKRELLAATGIDATLVLPFTKEFSEEEPEQFVDSVLVQALRARLVFAGPNFRFGHRSRGDVALLTELGARHGFEVRPIERALADGERPISSTLVRERMDRGDVTGATALLGRQPSVRATVVHGFERGRTLGYPTANLSHEVEGFVPADGVYAARLTLDGRTMPAAVSVGNNPTFDGVPEKQIEAHVLDETIDLYGKKVVLHFVEYIRPMKKFPDADALVAQMRADELRIRSILGAPRP